MEIIIIIIIIASIAKKRKKQDTKKQMTPSVQQRPYPAQQKPAQKKQQQKVQQQKVQQQKNIAQAKPVQPKPKAKEEMSTVEMLEAKALADDRKEMLEKQKQRMENKKHYGHHNYAQKYILGDPVPASRKLIYCGYCNAENLIPRNDRPGKYNCYFCREEL